MKLKSQILVFLGVVVIILITSGVFLSLYISEKIHSESLQQSIDVNANFIKTRAESSLNNNDFTPGNYEQKQTTFSNFFKNIDTSEILRIKVWSIDGTVIFSDSKEIVGKSFPDNPNFKSSLTGEIIAEIKEPEKPENVSEKGYSQLMEIYVPIIIDNEVSGIIETYVSLDRVNEYVDNTNQIIFAIVIATSFIVAIVLIIVYFLINKNIVDPIIKLESHTKQISAGKLDIHIKPEGSKEIQHFAKTLNEMSKEILVQRDSLIKDEKLKTVGELTSRIAHDLRNPLSSLKNTVEIMKMEFEDNQNEYTKENLERLNRGINRLAHDVEDVLDFVKVAPLKLEKTSLLDVIKASINRINLNSIKIKLPLDEIEIFCDRNRLEVAFINILQNAVESMKNNGQIEIRFTKNNTEAIIEFENSGPAIPEEILPKIFKPLFSTKQTGTGLGLVTTKNIIEHHGGTVSVKNNPVIFTVKLPKKL